MNDTTKVALNEIAPLLVLIGLLLVFLIFCLYMSIKLTKAQKSAKKKLKNLKESNNASMMYPFRHLYGLPVAKGTLTQTMWCADNKIVFNADGNTFNLSLDKVTDISVISDVEVQKQAVSSVGGAVGGAILMGPIGAVIGGRVKERDVRTASHYLVFTYTKDEDIENIGFELNVAELKKANEFADKFKRLKPKTNQVIDL